jgi:glycine betaine/proline transport system permease protein
MGLWDRTMETLSLVLAATVVAIVIGVPLGIAMARSDWVQWAVRPALDLMQTMPAFVYLIPAAMFFGLGAVPGAIATVIFSMPPVVRLTNLGIRQVNASSSRPARPSAAPPTQLAGEGAASQRACRPSWRASTRPSCCRCRWW